VGVLIILALIGFLILNPIVTIGTGKRGVVTEWGKVTDRILGEGIHMVMPIVQDVEKMDVTVLAGKVETGASSKDLQEVHTTVTINYHLDASKVNNIYQQYRKEVESRVIGPAIRESLKAATALFTAEELITKREAVKGTFQKNLAGSLTKANVILVDVFLTDFSFSENFEKAIEAKVTAEQEALTEKNNLAKVKYQAEQTLTVARADAEKVRITAQAINAQGGKDYVQMKAIEKWNGVLPAQMVPGSAVPFINLKHQN
jgi:regulator of protease activity HflC (stomatin/prohibitin superfamily)